MKRCPVVRCPVARKVMVFDTADASKVSTWVVMIDHF